MREGLFAGLALVGSALLNLATKHLFARERPDLWVSIAPEDTYSFPSGHAMGSMTLAAVRDPAGVAHALALAGGRGRPVPSRCWWALSRVYLGVHYPSDILAGWTAASVWTVAAFLMVFRHHRHPWQRPDASADDPEDV